MVLFEVDDNVKVAFELARMSLRLREIELLWPAGLPDYLKKDLKQAYRAMDYISETVVGDPILR